MLSVCAILSTDVNECVKKTYKCQKNSVCQNLMGSYECICMTGYTLDGSRENCIGEQSTLQRSFIFENSTLLNSGIIPFNCVANLLDIDECDQKVDDCGANAKCVNTPGSFTCPCENGFEDVYRECLGRLLHQNTSDLALVN